MKRILMLLVLSSTVFFSCSKSNKKENVIAFRETKNDAWGLMKEDGTVITKNEWDSKTYFPVAVSSNKLLLKKNVDGKETFEFYSIEEKPKQNGKSYVYATPFSEGLAGVCEENGRINFINEEMNTQFTLSDVDGLQIDKAFTFKNGFARIMNENDEFGFVNSKGEVIVKPKYTLATQFSDNSYAMCLKTPKKEFTGKILIELQNLEADSSLHSYKMASSNSGVNSIESENEFRKIKEQLENLRKSLKEESMQIINIVDAKGKVFYEKKWYPEEIMEINPLIFSNLGYFPYCDNKDHNWGIMDFNGEKIIKANSKFKGFSQIVDNYAVFKSEDGKYGIIDIKKDGEIIIRAKYDKMQLSKSGDKIFVKNEKKYQVKDLNDTEILKDEYDKILMEETENYLVQDGEKWIFVDEKGKNLNNNDYYEIYLASDEFIENSFVKSDYFNSAPMTNILTSNILQDSYLGFSFKGINVSEVADKYKLPLPNTYEAYGQEIKDFYDDKNYSISVNLGYNKMIIEQKMATVSVGDYTTEQPDGWIYLKENIVPYSLLLRINSNNTKASQKLQEIITQVKNSFASKGFQKINDDLYESSFFSVKFEATSITLISKTSLNEYAD